jgi:MFS family permease
MSLKLPLQNLKTTFPALTHRNFRYYFIGQCISLIGTWMQSIGQSWLVLSLTHSTFLISLITLMQFLPMMVFSLFAGNIIDRFPKKKVLYFTQTCLMLLALALATLTYLKIVEYWHVLVMAFLLGMVNTLDVPTRMTYFSDLVGKEDLMNAIALNSSIFNLARIVGPALAGFLIGVLGIAICFYLNALSFVAVLAALYMINVGHIKPQTQKYESVMHVFKDIGDGLSYIKNSPKILFPLVISGFVSLFAMNHSILIPLFAKQVLNQGAAGYGFMMTCMGIGSFIGAIWVATQSKKGPSKTLLIYTSIGASLGMSLLGLQRNYILACVTLFVMGLFVVLFASMVNSSIQIYAKDQMRGRVISTYTLLSGGMTPLGSLFIGGLMEVSGITNSMMISGFISFILVLITVFFLSKKAEIA